MRPGDLLGPYEVLEKLGEGGMGEVWKARDTRLGRVVALKVLSAAMLSESGRRRLMQEARAASVLQHPNIVTLHDVGSENGVDFLVMEYVAGETIEQRLRRSAPIPAAEVARIAAALARALSHAHEKGIVHRDLKPGNIILPAGGDPKLLDFGIAKRLFLAEQPDDDATLTAPPRTEEGAILGTIAYMSPEQAEGKAIDGRSDIFSFGAVLYEMISGRRAFEGGSRLATLSAILGKEPAPLAELAPSVPARLEKTILRCLRKNPEERFADAAALASALEEPFDAGRRKQQRLGAVAAVAGVSLAIAGFSYHRLTKPDRPMFVKVTELTSTPEFERRPRWSPDGKQIAWILRKSRNEAGLRIMDAATGRELRSIPHDPPIQDFAWSPDGKRIAILSNGWISAIAPEAAAGPEHRITQVNIPEDSRQVANGTFAWSPGGTLFAFPEPSGTGDHSSIFLFQLRDRTKRMLTSSGGWADMHPAFSPKGDLIAFVRRFSNARWAAHVADIRSGEARQVGPDFAALSGLDWSGDGGWLLMTGTMDQTEALWRVPANGDKRTVAQPLTNGRFALPSAAPGEAFRLAAVQRNADSEIVRTPIREDWTLGASEPVKETISNRAESYPQISPDGQRLAFASDRGGSVQIWVAEQNGARQVTSFGVRTAAPRWSPDGERLVCSSFEGKTRWVYVVDVRPGGTSRRLVEGARPSWSADGKSIYYSAGTAGRLEIWKIPEAGGTSVQVTTEGGHEPIESPDGESLFYLRGMSGTALVRRSKGVEQDIAPRQTEGQFAVTRDYVWFVAEGKLFAYSIARRTVRLVGLLAAGGGAGMSVSADQRTVFTVRLSRSESDIVLIEELDQARGR